MAFGDLLWTPSASFTENSNLNHFLTWLKEEKQLIFQDYQQLYHWSITDVSEFWSIYLEYGDFKYSGTTDEIHSLKAMPGVQWFNGVQLNYAEHLIDQANNTYPALISWSEFRERREISWNELLQKVKNYQALYQKHNVTKGDTVVAFIPNCEEATYAFIAASLLGAIWSSCSPDFGVKSVLDRFEQIKPKVFIACDGYTYGGKIYNKQKEAKEILDRLPSVKLALMVPFVNQTSIESVFTSTVEIPDTDDKLHIERVDFNDPIWVLYSSGTTGKPKAITHSHGGVLLEHKKYITLHNDVKPGEKFFWYSTTGWMMWNFLHASILGGATPVLYDGSPGYGGIDMLWKVAEEIKLEHFGTSAPFLVACMKKDVKIAEMYDLTHLRSIGSTGAPLPPEAFDYVYKDIKEDIWLCSMAGGTDICTAWVGSNPLLPVKAGELQCRTLGTAMEAWDDNGHAVVNELGEMIVTKPMPSMPIYFWNDENFERYTSSYFEDYPGMWRHGDWIKIGDDGQVIIYGRSDATLNRQGVRIGTAEIYRNINDITEITDSIIINLEQEDGSHYMPLFVEMTENNTLTEELISKIKSQLRSRCTPRHVPDAIFQIPEIPRTISGKKMEAPVKKILMKMKTEEDFNRDAMKNPQAMDWFFEFVKNL